jgi:biopolymer transport protein ExbB
MFAFLSPGVFLMKWLVLLLSFPICSFANEAPALQSQLIDLQKAFAAAPIIYTLLSLMSISSLALWLYSLATFRTKDLLPDPFIEELEGLLKGKQYDRANALCTEQGKLLGSIVSAGLITRGLGASVMIDAMKSEGKRASTAFWQRLSLLNDIVIIAPMLGLLGTVIGMFYAFYDVNRSIESINALFDGLGIAVGTTVVGLVVAIVAMIFYSTLKYRTVKALSLVENRALALSSWIQPNG